MPILQQLCREKRIILWFLLVLRNYIITTSDPHEILLCSLCIILATSVYEGIIRSPVRSKSRRKMGAVLFVSKEIIRDKFERAKKHSILH